MGGCFVPGCTNSLDKGFSMKRFPKDPIRKQVWLANMKRTKWKINENCRICEVHFAPEMWERIRGDGQRRLKRNAVPTLFTFPDTDKLTKDEEQVKKRRIVTRGNDTSNNNDNNDTNDDDDDDDDDIAEIQSTSSVFNESDNTLKQGRVYNPFSLTTIAQNYPIHQDVKFSKLPFYDIVAELLKPSSLIPNNNQYRVEQTFNFGLTPQQSVDILHSKTITTNYLCDFEIQIQLRFCLSETNCEQDDYYPPELVVKVNNRICALPPIVSSTKPGGKLKRFLKPINITPYVKLTSTVMNNVTIIWSNINIGPGYSVCINLVRKLTAEDLVKRLREKGAMNSDYTRSLIREKLNDTDAEVVTTCLRVSLICPLGKMRMVTPCRATTCNHLQCFDSNLFLQMNEKKSTWICPVCDKPILYNNLIIDGYFKNVLTSNNLPTDVNEIELNKDGTWSIYKTDTKQTNQHNDNSNETNPIEETIEIIGDDDDIIDNKPNDNPITTQIQSIPITTIGNNIKDLQPIEIVDLIDSDTDDDNNGGNNQSTPSLNVTDSVILLDSSSSLSSSLSSSSSSTTSSYSSPISSSSTSLYSPSQSSSRSSSPINGDS